MSSGGGGGLIIGNIKDTAIGHHAAGADDGDLAETQVLGIELQLTEAIQHVIEAVEALLQLRLARTCLLLKMLGFDEQTFVPYHGVGTHWQALCKGKKGGVVEGQKIRTQRVMASRP